MDFGEEGEEEGGLPEADFEGGEGGDDKKKKKRKKGPTFADADAFAHILEEAAADGAEDPRFERWQEGKHRGGGGAQQRQPGGKRPKRAAR